jgi:hypothetical protein
MIENLKENYMRMIMTNSKEYNEQSKVISSNNTKDNEDDVTLLNSEEFKEQSVDCSMKNQAESEKSGSIVSERSKEFTISESFCSVLDC